MTTIEQVREARKVAETGIFLAVRAAFDKFHASTGLWPSDVSVSFAHMVAGGRVPVRVTVEVLI